MPERVRLSRQKGFRLPAGAVNVARPTRWGNPFHIRDLTWIAVGMGFRADVAGRRAAAVELHRRWLGLEGKDGPLAHSEVRGLALNIHALLHGAEIKVPTPPSHETIRAELAGRDLACWCALGGPCHRDTILEIANSPCPEGKEIDRAQ